MEHHNNALMNPKVDLTKQDMSKEKTSIYSVAIFYENGTLIFFHTIVVDQRFDQ